MLSVRGDLSLTGFVCCECGFPLAPLLRLREAHLVCGVPVDMGPIMKVLAFSIQEPDLVWLQMKNYVSPLTVSI